LKIIPFLIFFLICRKEKYCLKKVKASKKTVQRRSNYGNAQPIEAQLGLITCLELLFHAQIMQSGLLDWHWNFSSTSYVDLVLTCLMESNFLKTTFQTFLCLFVIRKVDQRKTLSSQRKIWLSFPGKCFPFILDGKYFPEVVKKLGMSYYLLIISILVPKLLIAIYILF